MQKNPDFLTHCREGDCIAEELWMSQPNKAKCILMDSENCDILGEI